VQQLPVRREAWLAVRMNGEIVRPLLAVDLFVRGDLIEHSAAGRFGSLKTRTFLSPLYLW